jgi:hypothetical protein
VVGIMLASDSKTNHVVHQQQGDGTMKTLASTSENQSQPTASQIPLSPGSPPSSGLKVATNIKAGGQGWNHNEKQVAAPQAPAAPASPPSGGLKVSTKIKAGGAGWNHNEKLVAAR